MPRSADTVTESLSRVPPFPPVAAKLLSLLCNPSVDLGEVAELISSDPAFTARLLQRVNSVQFGLTNTISSVKQGVALLGIDLTRSIVVMHATAAYAAGALKAEELRRCWKHTIATAVLADEIARASNEFTQTAFTAGIMHDIGRLGLLVAYPHDYERIIRDAGDRCLDLLDFETEEFGLNHTEAGRLLAERWGLPLEMAAIAGRHHDPTEGAELSLLRIVHVACRLADALGFDVVKAIAEVHVNDVLSELPERARKNLVIDPVQFRARIERSISDYDSQQSGIAPEEALALLSPAPAEQSEAPAEPGDEAVADEGAAPGPVESKETTSTARHWIVAGSMIGAAILLALFFLLTR